MGLRKNQSQFSWDSMDGFLARENQIKTHSKVFSHVSASVLAVLFVLLAVQLRMDGLKGILFDALMRTQWWSHPNPAIVLIAYDDDSSARHSGSSKIPVEDIEQIFDVLKADGPKAVAVLESLNSKVYSDAEIHKLALTLTKVPHTYIGFIDDDSLGKTPPAPFADVVPYLPGFITRDTLSYGADGVTRRVLTSIDGRPTVYSTIARYARGMRDKETFSQSHRYRDDMNSYQTYINWQGPPGTYVPISSRLVVNRQVPPGTFKNKIVLLASAVSSKHREDFAFTPYTRELFMASRLETAAQSLGTLLNNNSLLKLPRLFNILLCLVVGLFTVNLVSYLSPGRGILLVCGLAVFLVIIGWIALFWFQCWIDLAHPLVVVSVGYYLVIPYRLVDEYRKRWHYQEKSELMAQLEQLKSNFLSLISHDLKTPIARIQGNAELVLNECGCPLSEKQQRGIAAIVHTTEDLSQYVETILDLTRIESARIPLQKATKDINTTILEVVESKRFLALEKNITLATELEPIFSFKFDVKLIRRVLSNLLENAIKYSPPNSSITLLSKEEGDWIKVSVADQGIGIPLTEQNKVFSKFYRCDNETTQTVKGTGLGLYLVKYFVELHKGFVELKSELGKGSVFTVSLPV
jgi:signal transduction histidine kinase